MKLRQTIVCIFWVVMAIHVIAEDKTALERIQLLQKETAELKEKKADDRYVLQQIELIYETGDLYTQALYNLAGFYAEKGEISKAYEYLRQAMDAGYWDMKKMRSDPVFKSLSNDTLFKEMVRDAWSNGYLAMLERPEREDFQQTDKIMETLAFKADECVADIGAGSGYFTMRVARELNKGGKVLAMDIRQQMLDHIAFRKRVGRLDNIELILVQPDDPQLKEQSVDTVLMVDTLHYVKDKVAYCKKLKKGLKPGGRIVIVDFIPKPFKERPWGPHESQQFSKEELDSIMQEAGCVPFKNHTFLTEQYFVEYTVK